MVRHVVFFSGGQDSTLVAVQLLRERKHPTLITIDNCFIGGEGQQNKEKIQRNKIFNQFKKEFGDDSFTFINFTWDGTFQINFQLQLWVTLFPTLLKSEDEVYFGYMRDDYADFHKFESFEKTMKNILEFQEKKDIKFNYPIEFYERKKVKSELKRYGYLDLSIHSGDEL